MEQDGGATQGPAGKGSRAGERTAHTAAVLPAAGRLPGVEMWFPHDPWCVHPLWGAEATELHGARLRVNLPQPGSLLQHSCWPVVLRKLVWSQGRQAAVDGGDRDEGTWLEMGKAPPAPSRRHLSLTLL